MSSRKRKRYSDATAIPTKDRSSYRADWKARHVARKSIAVDQSRNAGLAFASLGGWLRILNDGHHWQVLFPKSQMIEWWPASAKLVINQNWRQGIHAHRWQDVFAVARKLVYQGTVE